MDLQENDFIGKCGCEHFVCRLQPLIDEGQTGDREAVRCKHIKASIQEWYETMAPALANVAEQHETKKHWPRKSRGAAFAHW